MRLAMMAPRDWRGGVPGRGPERCAAPAERGESGGAASEESKGEGEVGGLMRSSSADHARGERGPWEAEAGAGVWRVRKRGTACACRNSLASSPSPGPGRLPSAFSLAPPRRLRLCLGSSRSGGARPLPCLLYTSPSPRDRG
eukprot:2084394-Rhodomonas_salina.1